MIDPRATVDPSAEIDAGVSIGPYSVIGPNVTIAAGTWIGPHVVINGPCTIGKDNRIYQFSSLGESPQDKKYSGGRSELVIGERNIIREFCTINRGTEANHGQTVVGDDNWIMSYVHIAHDCRVGNHTVFANGSSLAGHVTVEDYVAFGGFTLVHQFSRVGAYAFTGMGTALNRDLPPYLIATGNPAKTRGLNKVGLKRHGFSECLIKKLQRAYIIAIKSRTEKDANRKQLESLCEEHESVKRFVEFINSSKRGITL